MLSVGYSQWERKKTTSFVKTETMLFFPFHDILLLLETRCGFKSQAMQVIPSLFVV